MRAESWGQQFVQAVRKLLKLSKFETQTVYSVIIALRDIVFQEFGQASEWNRLRSLRARRRRRSVIVVGNFFPSESSNVLIGIELSAEIIK
jgi:hypothetical protein